MDGKGEGGRGGGAASVPANSTTPWVSHCPICSQERGRHRLIGGGRGGKRGKIDQNIDLETVKLAV